MPPAMASMMAADSANMPPYKAVSLNRTLRRDRVDGRAHRCLSIPIVLTTSRTWRLTSMHGPA